MPQAIRVIDETEINSAVANHAALVNGVHGLTTNISAAQAGAASPSAMNVFVTANGTPAITLGTPGVTNGRLILASHDREDFYSTVFQLDFGGHPDPALFHGYNPPNSSGYNIAEQSIYTGYEGYYWIDAGHQYTEWYVEYKNQGASISRRPFQTSVNIVDSSVNSFIYADNLLIANGSGSTVYWQILSGNATFSLPVNVVGVNDSIQCVVKGNSTQTNLIIDIEKSDNTSLFSVANDGRVSLNSYPTGTNDWYGFDQSVHATTATYAKAMRFSVYRDGAGPTFSWTNGFESTVYIRANSGAASTRFATAGLFTIYLDSANGNTSSVTVSGNIVQAQLVKSGTGTDQIASPHGLHVGDMGGTGSYTPAGIYIEAQTTPTSGAPYAIKSVSGRVLLGGLPTSATGLSSGELWNNGNVINIVP